MGERHKPTEDEMTQLKRILSKPQERDSKVELVGFVLQRVEDGRMPRTDAKALLGKVGLNTAEDLAREGISSYSNQELLLEILSEWNGLR